MNNTNIILISIGYWGTENPEVETKFPVPQAFVDNSIHKYERDLIASYLKKGREFATYLGWSFCRFKCGIDDKFMGHSCLTDGKYIWPEGLCHYIEEHEVWLPKEFILHVKEGIKSKSLILSIDQYSQDDFSWWLKVTHTNIV